MASKIPNGGGKVELNEAGMRKLMKSSEIINMLQSRMAKVQSALPGSEISTKLRPSRAAVKVIHGSDYDEANTGDLSKALDLAGGQRGTKKKFGVAAQRAKKRGA
tara:strand:+ start:196 stop:510 length:315 start_codon:yes stop_codon:yes gene_type:complete